MTLSCDRGTGNRSQVTCTQGNRSQVSRLSHSGPVPAWALPSELVRLAVSWEKEGASVIARQDDANEWRVVKLHPGEAVWAGWREVDLGVRPA